MRMLDLFCGEGLAAWGYWLSGCFSEIVGIDINPEMSTRYSFNLIAGDCINLDYEFLTSFDFIHASPPCQAYSNIPHDRTGNVRLVAATHLMLHATGKPYVIENVQGAMKELRPNLSLDGHAVGLPIERRRYFYVSSLPASHQNLSSGETIDVHGREYIARSELIRAFGLDCINEQRLKHLTIHGIKQGVPPAMTKWITEHCLKFDKFMIGENK